MILFNSKLEIFSKVWSLQYILEINVYAHDSEMQITFWNRSKKLFDGVSRIM